MSYKKENNLTKALDYLEKFEQKATKAMRQLLRRSSVYVKEIKKTMDLK